MVTPFFRNKRSMLMVAGKVTKLNKEVAKFRNMGIRIGGLVVVHTSEYVDNYYYRNNLEASALDLQQAWFADYHGSAFIGNLNGQLWFVVEESLYFQPKFNVFTRLCWRIKSLPTSVNQGMNGLLHHHPAWFSKAPDPPVSPDADLYLHFRQVFCTFPVRNRIWR